MRAIVCIALMLAVLAFSGPAMAAARTALHTFGSGVLPALLPMMILGKLLPNHTKSEHSAKQLWLGTAFFGLAAGSPASAQRAAGVWPVLSGRARECLLCFSGVMSPMFFTGTLACWLQSARDGWMLLGIHWLGAALTAGLWAMLVRPQQSASSAPPPAPPRRLRLPEVIFQCAQSLLCVCGAMMTFSMAASLVQSISGVIFPAWTARHADWMAVLWAVMEIGGGSSAMIRALPEPHVWLSALCGFGGLSIWLQNLLFLDGKIRPARLLGMRAVHGAVCCALVGLLRPF